MKERGAIPQSGETIKIDFFNTRGTFKLHTEYGPFECLDGKLFYEPNKQIFAVYDTNEDTLIVPSEDTSLWLYNKYISRIPTGFNPPYREETDSCNPEVDFAVNKALAVL